MVMKKKCFRSVWFYSFQEDDLPEEVNIDDLIDLPNDEERARQLQVTHKVKMKFLLNWR